MEVLQNQSLFHIEDLTLPSFQVIVMTSNLGCAQCTRRVSRVLSKLTGLSDYTVDVRNKLVIIKGDLVGHHWNMKPRNKKQTNVCPNDGRHSHH